MSNIFVTVKVEQPTNNPHKPIVCVFERVVNHCDGITIPFDKLVDSLMFIFGPNSIVSFSITNLKK